MGFLQQKHASTMVGGVLLALVASYGVRVFMAGGVENYFVPGHAEQSAIIDQLATVPGNQVLLDRLAADFPDDYEDLAKTIAKAAQSPGPDDRITIAGSAWIAEFFASHARDFAAAPIASLDLVMEREQQFLEALRAHDEYACAAYAKGAALDQPLSDSFAEISAQITEARFAAIKAGRTDQQLRFALTPADYAAVEATMREKGLSNEQVAVVFGEAAPDSIGAPLACEMAIELVSAIRNQPEGRRALLIGAYASGAR